MTALTRCLPLLALTLTFAACDSEPTAATPAPKQAQPEPQMQMIEAEASADDRGPSATPAAGSTATPAVPDPATAEAPPPAKAETSSIRDRVLVPPGTPEANAEAFATMRKSKHDSVPVGGIGPAGVHIDSFVVGRGFEKSRCQEEASEFTVGDDDRANVCIRVVHGGANDQQLKVKWTRNGRGPTMTTLNLKNAHAYRTRAYLPLRPYSAGDWTVTVIAEDGTVLGEGKFTVSK